MTILVSVMLPWGPGGGTRPGRKALSGPRSYYQMEHCRDFAEHALHGDERAQQGLCVHGDGVTRLIGISPVSVSPIGEPLVAS